MCVGSEGLLNSELVYHVQYVTNEKAQLTIFRRLEIYDSLHSNNRYHLRSTEIGVYDPESVPAGP